MPMFRRRAVLVEAKQWWPPGNPLHDPTMLHTNDPLDHLDRVPTGKVAPSTDYGDLPNNYAINTGNGVTNQLHPGWWVVWYECGSAKTWPPEAFGHEWEHVPDVPTPRTPEDASRDFVQQGKHLEASAIDLVKSLLNCGAIVPAQSPMVAEWLAKHGIQEIRAPEKAWQSAGG